MELLGRYGFSIMMSQVDNKGRCRLSAMGDILIHCACIHAQDVGFGVDKLHSTNVSWVLTALSVKMDKMPHFLDDIFVETWMEKRIHSIVFRHFIVYDKDNNVIGGGTSYWTVIDMAKRAVTDFAKLDLESSARAGVSPIGRPKRVRPCNDIFICQKEVVYADIDTNRHMYSLKSVEHALDAFSQEEMSSLKLKRFDVVYHHELVWGEQYKVCRSAEGLTFTLYRSDDMPAVSVCFE